MKKIIFSKQADHDIDLIPFWYNWYKNIFEADIIILTPVKLPSSSISMVAEYYEDKDILFEPIRLQYWDAQKIWQIQKTLVRNYIDTDKDYVVISADTDQFFEPIESLFPQDNIIVFERIDFTSDQTPTQNNINDINLNELLPDAKSILTPRKDFTAGYVNTFEHNDIFMTGHYIGPISRIADQNICLKEYQLRLRGINHFIKKIESLNFKHLTGNVSYHFKRWVRILKEEGRDGLIKEYGMLTNSNCEKNSKQVNRFRKIATKNIQHPPTDWHQYQKLLSEGEELFKSDLLTLSKSKFIELLDVAPNDCQAYNNLGVISMNSGETQAAQTYFEKSLEINPFYTDALINLGQLLKIIGYNREAIINFNKALKISDKDVSTWNSLGETSLLVNQMDIARKAFHRSLMLDQTENNIEKINTIIREFEELSVENQSSEKSSNYYDHIYTFGGDNQEYHKPYYESVYYKIWKAVLVWIEQLENQKIFEIGCGCGQFANMLFDIGLERYKGIDFSATAIQLAKLNNPFFANCFEVMNINKPHVLNGEYNIIVALEVFEHIENDLFVINQIHNGCNVIISVPNFSDESHVRFFPNLKSVNKRYGTLIRIDDSLELNLFENSSKKLYLIKGEKNNI